MAINCLIHKLINALEKREVGIGMFIDFRKAFDAVDHTILQEKNALLWYQRHGTTLAFQLFNRKTAVCCIQPNYFKPTWSPMWRSTRLRLRSTTFPVIYKWLCHCLTQTFCLFCIGKDLPSLIDTVNSELTIIASWLNANKVSLNFEKTTSYMIFRSRNKKLEPGNDIFINGCKIEQVQITRFLGVMIDCNLTWKYHINYVCSKIS